MRLPLLPTELHDAIMEQFIFDFLHSRLTISLLLDVVEGLSARRQQLLFSGVRNGKEIEQLQRQIDRIKRKGKRTALNYRLDDLSYYNPVVSAQNTLVIRLVIDHLAELLIQCDKITLQELI